MMNNNPHTGHRKRLKQKFRHNGFDHLPPHEILEFILMFSIPQGDVNPLAHRLIDRFGSLHGVADARFEELIQVTGVGEHTAIHLMMLRQFVKAYMESRNHEKRQTLETQEKIKNFFTPKFIGAREERLHAAFLDNNIGVITHECISIGNSNSVSTNLSILVSIATRVSATGIILAHNHLAAITPSTGDIATTLEIKKALHPINILLHDHVIVFGDEVLSLKKCGYLREELLPHK